MLRELKTRFVGLPLVWIAIGTAAICGVAFVLWSLAGWIGLALLLSATAGLAAWKMPSALARSLAPLLWSVSVGLLPHTVFVIAYRFSGGTPDAEPIHLAKALGWYEDSVVSLHEWADPVLDPKLQWVLVGFVAATFIGLAFRPRILAHAVTARRALARTSLALVAAASITAFTGVPTGSWSPDLRLRLEDPIHKRAKFIMTQHLAAALQQEAENKNSALPGLIAENTKLAAERNCGDHITADCLRQVRPFGWPWRPTDEPSNDNRDESHAARDAPPRVDISRLRAQSEEASKDIPAEEALARVYEEAAASSLTDTLRPILARSISAAFGNSPFAEAISEQVLHRFLGDAVESYCKILAADHIDSLRPYAPKGAINSYARQGVNSFVQWLRQATQMESTVSAADILRQGGGFRGHLTDKELDDIIQHAKPTNGEPEGPPVEPRGLLPKEESGWTEFFKIIGEHGE